MPTWTTARWLGNGLLLLGLLCFVGGAALLASGAPVDATTYAFGALALLFVGTGAAVRTRGGAT